VLTRNHKVLPATHMFNWQMEWARLAYFVACTEISIDAKTAARNIYFIAPLSYFTPTDPL